MGLMPGVERGGESSSCSCKTERGCLPWERGTAACGRVSHNGHPCPWSEGHLLLELLVEEQGAAPKRVRVCTQRGSSRWLGVTQICGELLCSASAGHERVWLFLELWIQASGWDASWTTCAKGVIHSAATRRRLVPSLGQRQGKTCPCALSQRVPGAFWDSPGTCHSRSVLSGALNCDGGGKGEPAGLVQLAALLEGWTPSLGLELSTRSCPRWRKQYCKAVGGLGVVYVGNARGLPLPARKQSGLCFQGSFPFPGCHI